MYKNVFVDTNIIIDFLDNEREHHQLAINLFQQLIEEEIAIYISEDMLSTIYFIIKDKQKVLNFLEDIVDEWNIVPFGKDVIKEAIRLSKKNARDFEDMLQCLSAKKFGCVLITNDKSFVDCEIEIAGYENVMLNH